MNTTTHPDPQPTLAADLFNDLFDPTLSTLEVCRTHALSFSDLRAVLEGDEFQQAMADLTAIERTRARALAPERRERALQTLDAIARQPPSTPSHTETVRKAAAALARATETKIAPSQSKKPEHHGEPDFQPPAGGTDFELPLGGADFQPPTGGADFELPLGGADFQSATRARPDPLAL